jgi:hypothetical protein
MRIVGTSLQNISIFAKAGVSICTPSDGGHKLPTNYFKLKDLEATTSVIKIYRYIVMHLDI